MYRTPKCVWCRELALLGLGCPPLWPQTEEEGLTGEGLLGPPLSSTRGLSGGGGLPASSPPRGQVLKSLVQRARPTGTPWVLPRVCPGAPGMRRSHVQVLQPILARGVSHKEAETRGRGFLSLRSASPGPRTGSVFTPNRALTWGSH